MDEVKTIVAAIQALGFVGLLIVLAVPKLKRFIFNGDTNHLTEKLDAITENHLHDIADKIDKLTDIMIVHNSMEIEILRDIKTK